MKTAEHYIKIFVRYADADALNRELAVLGPHPMGKVFDHQGELPEGSGYFHDVLSGRVDLMRWVHWDFRKAAGIIKAARLNDDQAHAALSWEWYSHRRVGDDKAGRVLHSGKDIAEYLGINYNTYKSNRSRALDLINAELGVLEA